MAMRIGKREQLSGGIILMLATIALVHIVVFRPTTQQYQAEKSKYQQEKGDIDRFKNLDATKLNLTEYSTQTLVYEEQYTTIIQVLNVSRPTFYQDDKPEAEKKPPANPARRLAETGQIPRRQSA